MSDWDSIVDVEASWREEGARDGAVAGERQGREQGRAIGLEKGHEIGHELGYYAGCAQAWLQIFSAQKNAPAATEAAEREEEGEEQAAASPAPSDVGGLLKDVDMRKLHFSDRGRRTLQQIIELVDSFPIDDVTNPEVSDRIDKIRSKFKVAVSQLGLVLEGQQQGLSF